MAHWRHGKMPDEHGASTDNDHVRVVDKLPKTPPSTIVFLRCDPTDQSGGNYWRWTGNRWEPDTIGATVPRNEIQ